jgi:hypothetical protein
MPITYGQYTKQIKLLPLILDAAGGAKITVRYGYVGIDNQFIPFTDSTFNMDPTTVGSVLDATPIPGLTRRDDLTFAIYNYLVAAGLVEAGIIT